MKIASALTNNNFYQIYVEKLVGLLGFEPSDKSYGRRGLKYRIPLILSQYTVVSDYAVISDGDLVHFITVYANGQGPSKPEYKMPTEQQSSDLIDILNIHGLGSYSGVTLRHADKYLKKGMRLHIIDLPSHGYSDGVHCDSNMTKCTEAIDSVINKINVKYSPNKLFLQGSSLGGLVLLKYLHKYESDIEKRKISGVSLLCPCVKVKVKVNLPLSLKLAARVIGLLLPRYQGIPQPLKVASKNKIELSDLNKNLYYRESFRIGSALHIYDEVNNVRFDRISLPVLVQQGSLDRVVDPEGAELIMQNIASSKKCLLVYKNSEHDLLNDEDSSQIFDDFLNWFKTTV